MNDYNHMWLDIESTGLDPDAKMLEFACVIATPGGEVLDANEWLIQHPDPIEAWYPAMHEVVQEMHRVSGLKQALIEGELLFNEHELEHEVMAFIEPYLDEGRIIPCGSGTSHFDVPLMARRWPMLSRRFTYWNLDVGTVRRFMRTVNIEYPVNTEDKVHRAMADTRDHFAEWHFYRQHIIRVHEAIG